MRRKIGAGNERNGWLGDLCSGVPDFRRDGVGREELAVTFAETMAFVAGSDSEEACALRCIVLAAVVFTAMVIAKALVRRRLPRCTEK